jgi:excisionase family DNA binding protein
MEKIFLTIQEAADLIRLKVPTIKRLVSLGKIPSYKVSGKRLFDREELIEWVRSQKNHRYQEKGGNEKRLSEQSSQSHKTRPRGCKEKG